MQHIFIVNNAAGNGKISEKLIPQIRGYFEKNGGNYTIEFTKYKGDATDIARRYAKTGERVRIYSCGGDGTLNETVNGIAGYDNVELGIFPCGSGNDFTASICGENIEYFLNVKAQTEGDSVRADLLRIDDGPYAINQVSMGFDAKVVDNFARFKNKLNISGKMAYILSVLYTLGGNISNEMSVEIDGIPADKERLLLSIAGNGKFQGGGMMSVPDADPFSREICVMTVKNVPKTRFLRLFPSYMKGEHKKYADIVSMVGCQTVKMTAAKPIPVTYDGEILVTESVTVSVVPEAVKIILPNVEAVKSDRRELLKKASLAKK